MNRVFESVIIFHYHLLPGGVTDVIKHAISSFASSSPLKEIRIVCGRSDNTEKMQNHFTEILSQYPGLTLKIDVLPELDYLSRQNPPPDMLAMKEELLRRYASPKHVWLIHNFHLGKNGIFTAAMNSIARDETQCMIYQIHDYPECARYANLKEIQNHIKGSLYPGSITLRYCVINQRDYEIMTNAGMPSSEIFLLENPLPSASPTSALPEDKKTLRKKLLKNIPKNGRFNPNGKLWLYPVRSIRRKNVLEGGLICRMMGDDINMILTLPGISSQEKEYSDLCEKAFSEGLIQGFWGTGTLPENADISFNEVINGSDVIFSPSVQEGFGYMYLNSLLWQKPLVARKLSIMGGFLEYMEDYPAFLYEKIMVPADEGLKSSTSKKYSERFEELSAYLSPELTKKLERELVELSSGDSIEFSYLSPNDQYKILEQAQAPGFLEKCRHLNAELIDSIRVMQKNKPVHKEDELMKNYGKEAYWQSFHRILNSFPVSSSEIHERREESTKFDKNLQYEFSSLEFLRLLYR